MRLPYEKYILYLLLTKHSDKEISEILRSYSLDKVGNVYLNKIRDYLKNADKEIRKFLSTEDNTTLIKRAREDLNINWVRIFGLEEAYRNSEEFLTALDVFSKRSERDALNIYCLCPDLIPEKISEIYQKKFGREIPIDCLDVYKDYFFDVSIMNDKDWFKYLDSLDTQLRVLYEAAPARRSKYVQWRMGDEVHLDPIDVSSLVMTDFFFLAQDAFLEKSDNWEDRAHKFAGIALSASDRAIKNRKVTGRNMKLDLINLLEEKGELLSMDDLDDEEVDEGRDQTNSETD